MGATVPTTMTLTQMSDLVAQDDGDTTTTFHGAGEDVDSYREWCHQSDGVMSYREWYISQQNYSPVSGPSPTSVAPDNEEVQPRQGNSGYSPISEDEQAPYVPRLWIVVSDSEAELSDSASDDGEEEEEVMEVPPPPALSAHQRDIRAARRSCVRGAFHLTLLFLFTVITPSDAADAFVAPANASYVATHGSALDLLDFSWVLGTCHLARCAPRTVLWHYCYIRPVHFLGGVRTLACTHYNANELKSSQAHRRLEPRIRRVSRLASLRHQPYGWIPHNAGFGFLDPAPSILHFNWFWDYIS